MTRRIFSLAALIVLIFSLSAAGSGHTPSSGKSDEDNAPFPISFTSTGETDADITSVSGPSLELLAAQLLDSAFSYDVSQMEPSVDSCGDLTTLRYTVDDSDFFIVEFRDDAIFPQTLYHFCHLGEDAELNLAKEESDYFDDEMVTTAKEFVQKVFGVDCAEAEVHAYGYANKITVQLELADGVFSVRFYYEEQEPVGVLFHNDADAFGRAMDTMQAKEYF